MIDPSNGQQQARTQSYQPSVEDVTDEHDRNQRRLAQQSAYDQSIHASRANSSQRQPEKHDSERHQDLPSPQDPGEAYYHNAAVGDVSPIVSAQASPQYGGYFPRVPDDSNSVPSLPQAPPEDPRSTSFYPQSPPGPTAPSPYLPSSSSLHSFPPPPNDPASVSRGVPPPPSYPSQAPPGPTAARNVPTQAPPAQTRPFPPIAPVPPAAPVPALNRANYVADEEAILKAQKHARWAISALNFEDVNTAVKELRGALESLGA